jgi:FixJ family two-component response regulator
LLSEGYELPIIFITAAADEEARARELTNGAVAYLTKPFDEEELLSAIQKALKSDSEPDD